VEKRDRSTSDTAPIRRTGQTFDAFQAGDRRLSAAHFETGQQYPWLEAQLQATLNMIPAHTWYAPPSGALTFLNERCADYLGLPKNHPLRFGIDSGASRDSLIPLLHPNDHEETRRIWSTCLSTGCAGEASFRVRNAEGGYRWFLSRAEPLRAGDGTLLYWIGVNLEIEERKQAEFYLAEGERLGHMGSWVLDPAGFFPYWSHELFHIYGLDPAKQGPGLEEYLAIVHPQDREFMRSLINRMFAEASGCDVTKRIVRPDGEVRYVRCVAVPIVENGVLKRIVGTAMDVTEHEHLTQELQRREAYLAEAQKLNHTGSFGWKVSSGEIFWSDETFRIFQCNPRTNPTVEFVLSRVHPDDRGLVQQQIDRASRDGKGFDFEHRLQAPDGSIKHVRMTAHPSRDSLGNLEFLGAVTDVSEQRQAEAVIREREREVRQIVDLAPQLVSVFGPGRERLYANRMVLDYLGTGPDEWLQRSPGTHIHPDDSERVKACWDRALGSGSGYDVELRLRKHDGSYRWFLARYNPVRDDKGQIMRWYVAGTDIEDRKQAEDRLRHENVALKRAEEKIREQEAELRQMLDLTPQHVHVLTADARLVYTNEIALQYHGSVLHDWQLRPLIDWRIDELPLTLFHPDDRERVMCELKSTLSSGSPHETEARLLRNDGKYLWFLFRFNPLRDEQGRVVRWYVAGTDIEDRKQAEERLEHENVVLREEIDKASMFEEIVGTSPPLQAVLSRVSKVARTDSTVLITGETGTGKELVARAIHRRSRRSSRAFVSVNCTAIPRDLIASELFGHEKGAFTGAAQRRLGRFELAGGGTIFLDEVGELPAETQVALLRVLQEHEFERVGGIRPIQTDIRVIAATNRDLQAAIAAGSFRSDLFYRLNVFPIEIPPVRDRREDIPMLVEYFIDRFARKAGKSIRGLNKKTLDLLQSYAWPGNIRELQNVIERSVIVCESENFSVDESWLSRQPLAPEPKSPLDLSQKLAAQEKEMIEAALRESEGRVFGPSGAAAKLGMPRSTLESKIRSLKIQKNRFKT
jgi:PAS domain S-box-containing protein